MSVAANVPQFFCTAPNADGIKFYARKPAAPAPASPVPTAEDGDQQKQQRISPDDALLKKMEEHDTACQKLGSDVALVKAHSVRMRNMLKNFLVQNEKKRKQAAESRAARKRRMHGNGSSNDKGYSAVDRLSPKSGLMLYCFVDDKLAKFLGIDEKTCVLRHDITSFYANYINQHGLKTYVQVEGKKKPATRTLLDDNLRELLGPENVAKIESGEVALTPIVFNKMVQSHYRGHAPAPTEDQHLEINAFRGIVTEADVEGNAVA